MILEQQDSENKNASGNNALDYSLPIGRPSPVLDVVYKQNQQNSSNA
jgi:hypothetical protein